MTAMYLSNVTDRGAMPALVKTLAFTETRLKVIAENVANSATPGYRARHLDTGAFQKALRGALDARVRDGSKPFDVRSKREVRTDERGYLQVTPSVEPVENVLSHDGTNLSIERQMADLAETSMTHEMATTILQGYYDGVRKAIRGTV